MKGLNPNIWDGVLNWPSKEVLRGQIVLKGMGSTCPFQTYPVENASSVQAWKMNGLIEEACGIL